MVVNIAQIEENLTNLVGNFSPESFIFELLRAYGTPSATVTRLEKGNKNLSQKDGQIILKRKLFYQEVQDQDIFELIDSLKHDESTYTHDPRFIVVTDYERLLAFDTKTDDPLDIKICEINKHPYFFGPWAKIERTKQVIENPADVKAAENMAKIYDEILNDNRFETKEGVHGLNIFLSRLLFCFFAEDTGIFEERHVFTDFVKNSNLDGSNLGENLDILFESLNSKDKSSFPNFLAGFPHVNGELFSEKYAAPKFTGKSRRLIIQCGELDWAAINPDIFGSMIQAVVHKEQRTSMGMHYTSVPNIMKVIKPLFLDQLQDEFEKHFDNRNQLKRILTRLENIRIFDPACGSGNFLIVAYKELRKLEIEIFERIQKLTNSPSLPFSRIQLSQFYGIELDDFAHEVAILSLWLAEHQMNLKFKEVFGEANPTLPLKKSGNITCGNATRIPWEDVCPKDGNAEIFVLGNPPYLGSKEDQVDGEHKADMDFVFFGQENYRKLDYVSCWFILASRYIENSNAKFAFVSTNSICQGEQVHLLWPRIFQKDMAIEFAYQPFDWSNNARGGAGVTCIIVGISKSENIRTKYLFTESEKLEVGNISPNLNKGSNLVIVPRRKPLSKLPVMVRGSTPCDDSNLILSAKVYAEVEENCPEALPFIKKFMGADDFINGKERYCLWINENEVEIASKIKFIEQRIEKCRESRLKSPKAATRKKADKAWQFDEVKHQSGRALFFPVITSHRRKYVPIGFLTDDTVISNKAQVIYGAETFVFGILSSRMHVVWLSATSARMGKSFQYSSQLSYNTFPFPNLSSNQRKKIEKHVLNVLEAREFHSEKTMAGLYDPDDMPEELAEAHHLLDIEVERCYRSKPFKDDEKRLDYLFSLYEEMLKKENEGELL